MEDKGGKRLARNRADAARNDTAQGKMPAADVPESGAAPVQSRWKRLWSDYGYLLVTLAVVVLIFRVLLQLAYVPSGSMETTIPTKSLLVGWRLPYLVSDPAPQRGSIVTFWDEEMGHVLVKRVVGLPGETVSWRQLSESDQDVATDGEKDTFQVPADCIFVMGDNRTGSHDSRYLREPYIPVSQVQGRMLLAISIGSGQSWQGVRWIG